ncbi:MAG TPA: antitoxin [Trebonia sp.]|jgi:hypothetical protein|nr:antitoxin [Trebonia sp.]
MPDFGKLAKKVKGLAGQHPDTVGKAVEKAEEMGEKKTGGQYDGQIEQAGHWAEGYLGAEDPGAGNKPAPPEGGKPDGT